MNLLDHVSNEWQSATEIRLSLKRAGIDLPVSYVIRMLQQLPSVVENKEGQFRQVAFHKP